MMVCRCEEKQKPVEQRNWKIADFVICQKGFTGVVCNSCKGAWQTKKDYVAKLERMK